jgi:hypothetical protein
MSSNLSALLSATFYEAGYDHLVELVHQRDPVARRHLASLDVAGYDAEGKLLFSIPVDPRQEILDLGTLMSEHTDGPGRVMVVFDARYDERVFPYRPHHYAYFHRHGSASAPLYYAVTSALGGVPDRIGATGINNFESYLFRRQGFAERYSLMLGNLSRFSTARAEVFTHYGPTRVSQEVAIAPKAHVEVPLASDHGGEPLQRVELKGVFRLASYVAGRRDVSNDFALFDHLFTYFK